MLDLVIRNGTVVDGSGQPGFRGDVGIRDGRIVAVGKVDGEARETLDASGRVVTPGFIDVHTHYDAQVFWDPYLTPSCYHGVTTVMGGYCGFSIAPLTPEAGSYLMPMLARVEGMPLSSLQQGVPWDWSSFGSYLDKLENKLAVNAGFHVGHSAVRRVVMGDRAVGEQATEEELTEMEELVDASLREGALGFSTTVSGTHNDADGNPVPSRFASREELMRLAAVCSRHEGTSLELLPDLDFGPETLELLSDFSVAGRRTVNWNVLTVQNDSDTDQAKAQRMLSASDVARRKGGRVVALTLPFMAKMRLNFYSGFVLDALPGWGPLFKLSIEERIEKLRDPAYRENMRQSAEAARDGFLWALVNWDDYTLEETHAEANRIHQGKTLAEIGKAMNKSPFDAMLDLAVEDGLQASFMPKTGTDSKAVWELRGKLWHDERTIIGASDAGAHVDMIDSFAFSTNLLDKGVRTHKVISLEEAVHQISEVPARLFGLKDRGLIQPGMHADVVVFDPDTVASGEPYTRFDLPGDEGRLYADAFGIDHVLVNGQLIIRQGELTGATPGTVLRSGRDTETVPIPADQ